MLSSGKQTMSAFARAARSTNRRCTERFCSTLPSKAFICTAATVREVMRKEEWGVGVMGEWVVETEGSFQYPTSPTPHRPGSSHRLDLLYVRTYHLQFFGILLPHLGDERAVVLDLAERGADFWEIDGAVQDFAESGKAGFATIVVLDVDATDAFAERADPVVGLAHEMMVAGIKINADPFAAELIDELAELERRIQETVPDVLQGEMNLVLLRVGDEFLDALGRHFPALFVRDRRVILIPRDFDHARDHEQVRRAERVGHLDGDRKST